MAWLLLPTQHGELVGVNTNDVKSVMAGAWLYFDHPTKGAQKRESPGGKIYWSLKDPDASLLQSKDLTDSGRFARNRTVTVTMPAEQVLAAFNRAEAEQLALAAVIKETPA